MEETNENVTIHSSAAEVASSPVTQVAPLKTYEQGLEEGKLEIAELIKAVKDELVVVITKADVFNPAKNDKAISIIQQEDGNWTGTMQKFGKVVSAREVKPEDVLLKLITHSGE